MNSSKTTVLVATTLCLLAGCGGEPPTLDGSSVEAWQRSLKAVEADLTAGEREQLRADLQMFEYYFSKPEHNDSEEAYERLRARVRSNMDTMTAREIRNDAETLKIPAQKFMIRFLADGYSEKPPTAANQKSVSISLTAIRDQLEDPEVIQLFKDELQKFIK